MKDKIANASRFLHLLKSKTILFFGIIGTWLLNNATDTIGYLQAAMPQLQEYLPTDPYKTLGVILIAGGIVLRLYTKDSVGSKLPPKRTPSTLQETPDAQA